ncbi:hypothetical protein RJ641_031145 [Dillenia turbinata]|uniref:Protein XRI1 n=1 Tax=Dillenia turbinata TaxID=194707 RepID=A0AAN8ZH77_9MAGN
MDYNNDNKFAEMLCSASWEWQGEDYYLQKDSDLGSISQCLWEVEAQNGENLSNIFDETTPIKACGDLTHQVSGNANFNKVQEDNRQTSSQVKRRRMLQFDNEAVDCSLACEEISSTFMKSKESESSFDDALGEVSQWVSGFSDDASASSHGALDQSSEGWLVNCFNDAAMHFSPDEMNPSLASEDHFDISEFCNIPPEIEATTVKERPSRPRKIVFKGKKSLMRTPTKMASSVAYPFAFIKPCGVHGDVTLKDINQRILTPPPSKTKKNEEDPSIYPTSAFSGKPVVGKTKIRTEGGKGSITIMRTKG